MFSKRVAITGMGVFCSIGKNGEEFLHSLREGRTGIGPITLFDASKYPSKIGAEIRNYQPEEFYDHRQLKRLSRTDQFALIAAEEAVVGLNPHSFPSEELGVCLGAGAGGMACDAAGFLERCHRSDGPSGIFKRVFSFCAGN